MKKILITSSGSFGPAKKIIRDEISWVKSANAESKLFKFNKSEVFAAACGSDHSLHKYAKFRSELIHSFFVDDQSLKKTKTGSFSTQYFVKNMQNKCPSIIYTIPNILRVICLFLKKNKPKDKFEKVKLILSGGEAWISGLELLVGDLFPNAKIVEFYGAAELGFVGWGDPGKGYSLFPKVKAWCDSSCKIWVESPYIADVGSPATVGDTGWFDQEGLLHLTGRTDRDFRLKGVSVSPEKIEKILKKYSQIENAYVFKKTQIGKEGKIAIIIYTNTFKSPKVTENDKLESFALSSSLAKTISNILIKEKMQIPISRFRKIKVWPLLNSGKTNFRQLENSW